MSRTVRLASHSLFHPSLAALVLLLLLLLL
jgi:hypothetical protein